MKLTIIAVAGLCVAAFGSPASKRQAYIPCSGSYNAECCATDVLGLADLDCAQRKPDVCMVIEASANLLKHQMFQPTLPALPASAQPLDSALAAASCPSYVYLSPIQAIANVRSLDKHSFARTLLGHESKNLLGEMVLPRRIGFALRS